MSRESTLIVLKVLYYIASGVFCLNLGIIASSFHLFKRRDVTALEAFVSGYRNPFYYFRGDYAPYCRPLLAITILALIGMIVLKRWA